MAHVPIIQVSRIQEDGDEISNLKKMKPHVPGIVIFADHNRQMPWSVTYHAVVMFADISGFTALCEKYSHMGQSGVDQLTRTLNEYLSALVEGILRSDGDILKFAGDAILAIWRVGRKEELQSEFVKVAKCCLDIQEKCGEWDTDIGVKLTVKIGLAAGEMSVTFLGNKEFRHYVELGPAVTAVNAAEHFCQSGMVVISPDTWEYCEQGLFELEPMEDEKHMRLMSLIPTKRTRSQSLPTTVLVSRRSFERRMSDEKPPEFPAKGSLDLASPSKTKDSDSSDFDKPVSGLKTAVENKFKIGSRFGKLRKIVTAVTEMKLDVALRLYILSPVLKKLDDNQPLEYLSEMRQVSIVFMNLVLSEGIDTASTLQTIFELVYSRTKAMNGSLNKLFLFDKGCTFLLIFGLPGFKSENDCAHALMSSGRMKSQLHKVQGVRNVSIGVTTGTTFCGVVGHPKRHEYSVIGRKVNMAARLMMNYPDKVTCDTDTFQTCRLPASYFVEMATKQLKGLKNVGVIREFAGFSGEQKTVAKQITHSMYPILGRQMEEFMFGDQVAAMRSEAPAHHRHLVFSGPAGIGKTRLLDQILSMSQQAGFRVISCQCDLEDSSYPYFITSHILQSLLRYTGFSEKLSKDAYLTDAVGVNNAQYLFLLNGILDCQLETPDSLIGAKFNEQSKRQQLLRAIAAKCLHSEAIRECVIVIDDAHNVDTSSWQFLCEMVNLSHCLIILSIRPTLLDVPTCRAAKDFMEDPQVKVVDLGSLEPKYMAPLACQMLDVISIPRDLDKLLRERVHGVPLWCMEFLRDLVKNEQLLVVNDDGQSDLVSQSTVAPNQDLIKPLTPARELELPSTQKLLHVAAVKVQPSNYMMDTEKDFLSATGYLYASPSRNENHLTVSDLAQISAGGAMTSMSRPNSSIKPKKLPAVTAKHRLAVFEKDVKPDDIPIPSAMKELVIARIDSMRASEQLLIKCAAVLGQKVRKDILETLMPKAHRSKLSKGIRKLMENGIFECSNAPKHIDRRLSLGERSNVKSKCYCNAEEVAASEPNSVPSCNEPMFTNKLLQETAYEILMESQRIELHTKAATFLELSADVLRQQIPYHILGRPPPREDLENQLKRIDLKMQDLDTMINMRSLRPDNRIADLTFARTAAEMKTKRGRRLAVSVTSENNFPLARKIAEGGTPVEQIGQLIDSLLPVYDSLIYHWKNAKEHTHLVNTMIEAISASVERKKLKKAEELLESAFAALQEASEVPDSNLVTAKLFRMKGKFQYESGQVLEAYTSFSKAANALGMKEPTKPSSSWFRRLVLLLKFLWYWKTHYCTNTGGVFTLEKGYLLAELYKIDKEQGFHTSKLAHAMKYFTKLAGTDFEVHQLVMAYAAMIECCMEKTWNDIFEALITELLQICAERREELSSDDRHILCETYASSCIYYMNSGDLRKASAVGGAANEICCSIQDQKTMKFFAPQYFYVMLFRKTHFNSIELLQHFKYGAQVSDDLIASTVFRSICLEIALLGACPPETVVSCLADIKDTITSSNHTRTDGIPLQYAVSCALLWLTRMEEWADVRQWDVEMMSNKQEHSFYQSVASIHRLEQSLLMFCYCTECGENTQTIKRQVLMRSKDVKSNLKRSPILAPRYKLLKAYWCAMTGHQQKMKSFVKKGLALCAAQGNVYDKLFLDHHLIQWQNGGARRGANCEWIKHAAGGRLKMSDISEDAGGIHVFTLPLPCIPR